ncbi:MAG: deoxyguanosinetriphosphate triphosphohydrolase family protein [Promethearchaeota archaeon]
MIKLKFSEKLIKEAQRRITEYERKTLNHYASFSTDASRRYEDYAPPSIRSPFGRDGDRIIHSLSYARYNDKSQVYFWFKSDLFQHRLLHVQLVSKISRYVAKILGLNQDLVDAIGLGHDIGHSPFSHDGERFLDDLCKKNGLGCFKHNYESAWFLQEIEMQNLTLHTLDGIISHNGEIQEREIKPLLGQLSWKNFDKDMENLISKEKYIVTPKTMEAALVRFVDTISYISRDIRDSEYLGILSFRDIPSHITNVLGDSNREIIGTLISDLVENFIELEYFRYSDDIFNALVELYNFNVENIYMNPKKKNAMQFLEKAFNLLWNKYLEDLENDNRDSEIFKSHFLFNLKEIKTRYKDIQNLEDYHYYKKYIDKPKIVVRDFIAGMTDSFFIELVRKIDPKLSFERPTIY